MEGFEIEMHCGGPFQTNGYLVKHGGRSWLFDAPGGVTEWLQQKSVQLDGLILTHQHHDHVMSAGEVIEAFDCPIWAHSEPSEDLTMAERLEQMTGIPFDLDPYQVNHLLEGETELELAQLPLQIFHVPGHSPDSLCFLLKDRGLLIGGDVLFRGGIGRTDFHHSDHELLLAGIKEKLWPLPDDTQVLPGHGPSTTIGLEKATNRLLR